MRCSSRGGEHKKISFSLDKLDLMKKNPFSSANVFVFAFEHFLLVVEARKIVQIVVQSMYKSGLDHFDKKFGTSTILDYSKSGLNIAVWLGLAGLILAH